MYCLNDKQIDFILGDISARGIGMVSLQQNLLDHICCIIEQDLDEDGDFEHFYQQTVSRFYKSELREIEVEAINLLTHKNYYAMKKVMLGSGAVSSFLLTVGLILKFGHWPGAAVCLVLGIFILSFVFLPLVFTLKIKEQKSNREKAVVAIGALAASLICLWILFKIMHWPFANVMSLIAIGIMIFVFLPVYLFTGIRNPETKTNTIVSSILIIAGCGLVLTLVRSPAGTREQYAMNSGNFFRNEMILKSERNQGSPLQNATEKNIFSLCESIKRFLVFKETGSNEISADFESKGQLLGDSSAAMHFSSSTEMEKEIAELCDNIEVYNKGIKSGQQPISLARTILKAPEKKVTDALNDFVQIQMIVLQNQQKPIASR
ncbi:hypothetical protein FNO01nite_28460 [Flavobacterium noncentrifugens]|uniref:Gliding motility-associated protein GldM N-terminal domain-containing protein n=1 Tax=Flavobacterium noncentrifugens TaxID=1128970 RepID=A0A1G8XSX6_9FLAO|nr:hypothetical protein [Flavobacterium noncentrifugens]GEP52174.1 hypothetical protein FNO01nite_28460 [Flavobacterium noncentrifugens]SDJ93651.1 hypothetical protein SAMN04487935_2052 [Flavobacterium noncentrifugens]